MDKQFTSLRCPNVREHSNYCLCSRLLGAVKDGKIYLYCEMCKQFYEIVIKDNDTVEMIALPKSQRLNLKSNLKLVK